MAANDPRRIDLHTHTTASDGSTAPAELVLQAVAAQLDVIAITDHDGTAGWQEVLSSVPPGLTVVPGIEISAYAQEGERRISLHLLGYLIDPANPDLVRECDQLRASRELRAERIVAAMVADGHPVSWERTLARAEGAVGRPHIASELVEAGLIGSVPDAFTDAWIGSRGKYYLTERKMPVLDAIGLVATAGGVSVFAHPGAAGRGEVVGEATIEAMVAAGLSGLEVDHPDHDEATRTRLRALAERLGLLVTGSSDYHGDRKSTRLGDNLTAPAAYEALLGAGTGSAPVTG